MTLSNKNYELLRSFTQIIMPGIIAFYTALAGAWEWSNTEAVVVSLAAFNALLGVLLKASTNKYNQETDGELIVTGYDDETGIPQLRLVVTNDPEEAGVVPKVGRVARLRVKNTAEAV